MKKNIKLGSYVITKENNHLKVSHENGSWNFRIVSTKENIDSFFSDCKEGDWRKYFENVFAGAQVFTILGMQNPQYMQAWMTFHNAYFDALSKEITPEEDKAILAEEEVLHNMREEAGKEETETKTEKDDISEI